MKYLKTFEYIGQRKQPLIVIDEKINDFKGKLTFYDGVKNVGYIVYQFKKGKLWTEWIELRGYKVGKDGELYIDMLEVPKKYRRHGYALQMLNQLKDIAKEKGATVITTRPDYGMGYGEERDPSGHIDQLNLKAGYKYLFTQEEIEKTEQPGTMYFDLRNYNEKNN